MDLKIQIKSYQFDIQLVTGSIHSLGMFPKIVLKHLFEKLNATLYLH